MKFKVYTVELMATPNEKNPSEKIEIMACFRTYRRAKKYFYKLAEDLENKTYQALLPYNKVVICGWDKSGFISSRLDEYQE